MLGSVSLHGICPSHLGRQLARYRSVSKCGAQKFYHLGVSGKVSRNTLANTNQVLGWRICADFEQVLIANDRSPYAKDKFGVELDDTV